MKWNSCYIGLLLVFCSLTSFGQIEEVNMLPPTAFERPIDIRAERGDGTRADDVTINYLYDTLSLPLFDDFYEFLIKVFPEDTNDPAVFDSLSYSFRADGATPDSLQYRDTAVYNYVEDPINGGFDTIKADSIEVIIYDTNNPFLIKETIYVYPAYSLHTQNGITRKILLEPDSVLYNIAQRHYFANDDGNSLWIGRGVFWNQSLADRPPTLGIITFDGLDSLRWPYDNSEDFTYGLADRFASKPINLFDRLVSGVPTPYLPGDSIAMSFFYQPEGLADQPEEEDSLILEFYSPTDNTWNLVWSHQGDTNQSFGKVVIPIDETRYLQKGFRFRFSNYATLSGNFDHWHLDYIEIEEDKHVGDTTQDFAVAAPLRTTIKEFTAMPWLHYKEDPWKYTSDSINLKMNNLSNTTTAGRSRYLVYKASAVNPLYTSQQYQNTFIPANSFYPMDMPFLSNPENFTFPLDQEERQWFRVICESPASLDPTDREDNNTLEHSQIFDRYYAYDDGTAEKTYHLNLVGTQVAVEYEFAKPDTLKAIYINFVEAFTPTTNHRVNLKIYHDLSAQPIYESGSIEVITTPAGQFHRYTIPGGIPVTDKVYIGWEQISNYKTYVGYDNSYNNRNRTFISEFDGVWKKTAFTGTILIRADLGNGDETPLSDQTILPAYNALRMYPNPAYDQVWIDGLEAGESATVRVYNIQGKEVLYQRIDGEAVQVSGLPTGFYVVRVSREGYPEFAGKLIITK